MTVAAQDFLGLTKLLSFFDGPPRARSRPRVRESAPPHRLDAFADKVLTASSKSDLDERLEDVASDPEFWRFPLPSKRAIERMHRRPFSILDRIRPPVRVTLGEQGAEIFCRGWGKMEAFARAILPALREAPIPKPGEPGLVEPNLTDVMYDIRVPLETRRGLLAVSRAVVGSIAVLRATKQGTKLDPWLSLALAERVEGGVDEFLAGFVAAAQGQPPTGVSPDEVASWHRDAIASGRDAYFPLGGPDHSGAG